MAEFKVTDIVNQRTWEKEGRRVVYYDIKVEGQDKLVNLGRKPDNPLKVGDTLEGSLEDDGKGKLKFVKANSFNGGRGMSPEQQKSIVRQHSQDMALRYMEAKGIADFKLDDDFRKVINWFAEDAGR